MSLVQVDTFTGIGLWRRCHYRDLPRQGGEWGECYRGNFLDTG